MAAVKVSQVGRLGVDPELKKVGPRDSVKKSRATLFVLSGERWMDDWTDKTVERTTAIRWVLWGKRAENAAAYLKKGSKVAISGRVENNEYFDREGRNVHTFQFVAAEIEYLGSTSESEAVPETEEETPRRCTLDQGCSR